MTLEETIIHCEEKAEELEKRVKPYQCESINKKLYEVNKKEWDDCLECAKVHLQLAEWLRELKKLRNFTHFIARNVMEDDFEENGRFYTEVFCRRLNKLGVIRSENNKWIYDEEVNADDG